MELQTFKSICAFIDDAKGDREIAYYVGIYQKALEALQNILIAKKGRKISDKDLYKVFKICLRDKRWYARIEIIEESYNQSIEVSTFLPLELVEFLIDNAKDKSVVLGMHQSREDFLKNVLDSGRADIAGFLVKNGVEFKQEHLNRLRYDWKKMLKIEVEFQGIEGLEIEKDGMLKKIWELLISQGFSLNEIYSTGITLYNSMYNRKSSTADSQYALIYALRNNFFSEEVLDNSFQGLPPQGGINLAVLGKEGADLLDNDTAYAPLRTQRIVPFVFAMFEDKTYDVLEYALFLGLHKGRKNDKGEDFESFLQQKIDEYIILTTKGGNSYGTIFQEDKDALAYFKALQRFMSSLDSIKRGEIIEVDNETLAMFANIEEIPLSSLDTSKATSMKSCFGRSMRRDFSGIEKWNVSQVKNLNFCFESAYFFDVDISSWDISSVEEMHWIFSDAFSLKALPSWCKRTKDKKFIANKAESTKV